MRFLAVVGSLTLFFASQAHAIDIAWSFNATQPIQGSCVGSNQSLGSVGDATLGCYITRNDLLTDPSKDPLDFLRVQQPIDTTQSVRAAVYEATGIDPGELIQSSKVDDGQNHADGLSVYNEFGNVVADGLQHGLWEYNGSDILSYFVIKTAQSALIWDISQVTRTGINNGDNTTALQGQFEMYSWYDLLGESAKRTAMSHIAVYSRTQQGPPSGNNNRTPVPIPATLWLFVVAYGMLMIQRHRSPAGKRKIKNHPALATLQD